MNPLTVTVIAQVKGTASRTSDQIDLQLNNSELTVKEVIERYVSEQIERKGSLTTQVLLGTIPNHTGADYETQVYKALNAFQQGEYYLFIDDRHVTSLQEKVKLSEASKVRFIRITPLVGG